MEPHDEIIASMIGALGPLNGEIRLLARLNDNLINNRSEREVFFLIPDLHLISAARRIRFGKYGFNHEETGLLARLLGNMAALKASWDGKGRHTLVTVQLGDFIDMWREFPRTARPEELQGVYDELRNILYRGSFRRTPCLKATMIMGNHDTKSGNLLAEVPFRLKGFNRTDNDRPFLFVTHGDAFDLLETMLPDPVEEFAVYFIGDLTPVNKYQLHVWGASAGKINKSFPELDLSIQEPKHQLAPPEGAIKVVPEMPLPDLFCQEFASPEEARHRLFGKIYASLERAEQMNMPGQHVRVAAIGHTHKASMSLCRPAEGGRPLVLMDIGAWIEQCVYPLSETGRMVTEPSAQLGVIHGNDARIYQIRIPASV